MDRAVDRLVDEIMEELWHTIKAVAWLLARWMFIGWITSVGVGWITGIVIWLVARIRIDTADEDTTTCRCCQARHAYPKPFWSCFCINATAGCLLFIFILLLAVNGLLVYQQLDLDMLQECIAGFSEHIGEAMANVFTPLGDGNFGLLAGGSDFDIPMRNPLDGYLDLSNFDVDGGVGITRSVHLRMAHTCEFPPLRPKCAVFRLNIDPGATVVGVLSSGTGLFGGSIVQIHGEAKIGGVYNTRDWHFNAGVIASWDPMGMPPPDQFSNSDLLVAGLLESTTLGMKRMHMNNQIMTQLSTLEAVGPLFTYAWGILALVWTNMLLSSVLCGLCCADCCRSKKGDSDRAEITEIVRRARGMKGNNAANGYPTNNQSYSAQPRIGAPRDPGVVYGVPHKMDALNL